MPAQILSLCCFYRLRLKKQTNMKKKVLRLSFLIAALFCSIGVAVVNMENTPVVKNVNIHENYLVKTDVTHTVLPDREIEDIVYPPFVGRSINGFKEALGYKESRGNYFVVNSFGYMGKYQFGASALRAIGVRNKQSFLNHPEMQERALIVFLKRNKWLLRKEIEAYNGTVIHGVTVTESGILAAAHLAGAGNVKRYLRTRGGWNFKDAYGTSIWYYMKKFSGYDLSHIEPNRRAKI